MLLDKTWKSLPKNNSSLLLTPIDKGLIEKPSSLPYSKSKLSIFNTFLYKSLMTNFCH